MADTNKDTIYIDIDDEITAIIDKVRGSSGKVVALVLPKRAATLQSVVNMKLLKRTADETKKNLVLVTTESGLLPLAGAVGLHVAKTPNSHPEIPAAPVAPSDAEESVDETADLLNDDDDEPATLENAGNKPVGELAGASTMPLPARPPLDSGIETLELDNEDKEAVAAAAAVAAAKAPKPKKDKKLQVPDFDRFRMLLLLGGILLAILIIGGYFAIVVLPKATISIKTDASNVNTNVDFTLSTSATTFSATSKTVPAKQAQTQKTYTGTATTTGQKNTGAAATGTVQFYNCDQSDTLTGTSYKIPAGTGLSSGGHTYITQESVVVAPSHFKGTACRQDVASSPVDIKAQAGGTASNVSNAPFSVAYNNPTDGSKSFSANGSASGGTDNVVQVVSQADIDSAKGKISSDDSSVQSDLESQLKGQGLYAITTTYNTGTPTVTNSANVGDAATSVTVTENVTYTMLGAKQSDLTSLVDNDVKSQIDTSQQGILNDGITQSAFKVTNPTANGAAMNVQTVAEVGPSINTATIASEAAGKKSGDIESSIKSDPDVTDVNVHLSPFWVTKAPKKTSKITVIVAKPTKTANAD